MSKKAIRYVQKRILVWRCADLSLFQSICGELYDREPMCKRLSVENLSIIFLRKMTKNYLQRHLFYRAYVQLYSFINYCFMESKHELTFEKSYRFSFANASYNYNMKSLSKQNRELLQTNIKLKHIIEL